MSRGSESWENESRFFVPNEDAAVARAALAALPRPPRRPAFVCGSGMLLLDVLTGCPGARAVAVDVSSFQIGLFRGLQAAIAAAAGPGDLWDRFAREVHPRLREHYLRRGQDYTLDRVRAALDGMLGIRLFSDGAVFRAARALAPDVEPVHADMVEWLDRPDTDFDFVHLSNIIDYLDPGVLPDMFAACRRRGAPVLLILTTACDDPEAVRRAWTGTGYAVHPASEALSRANRALGARRADRSWVRTGEVALLV